MLDAMSDRKNPVPFLYQLAAGKNLHNFNSRTR